ncbi:MAG: hypothetical protein KC440_06665 [Nitrosarchaeum sp.]|nr:hypothetical protein [Nitrosarchaeum sp.]
MLVIVIGFSFLSFLLVFEITSDGNIPDDRESLKEVAYSNNVCIKYYRTEFFDMLDEQNYDYQNDPIFQECYQVMQFEKYANTAYSPDSAQLEAILEYCIDSKDLVGTKGLSYSNSTHYIDTVTCDWQELEMIKSVDG